MWQNKWDINLKGRHLFFTLYIEPLIACSAERESTKITVFNGLKS
jgi:hypothetical protein